MWPEQPTKPAWLHMSAARPTRQPGTPVGELLARPSSQRASLSSKPSPSQSPGLPLATFYSDSDSDLAYLASSSSPEQGEKPKPSAAPHLAWTTSSYRPPGLCWPQYAQSGIWRPDLSEPTQRGFWQPN